MRDGSTDEEIYQQGLLAFKNNDIGKGVEYFIIAAKNNYKPAIKELGICYLYGVYFDQSLKKSILYLNRSKSEPEAQYELSRLFFFGHGVTKDLEIARKLLIASAKSGYNNALNLMALCLQIDNKVENAEHLLCQSLNNNDVFANHLLKNGYINKVEPDTARIINSFQWPVIPQSNHLNMLNQSPGIYEQSAILSDIECEYIKFVASPFMRESMIVDPKNGNYVRDPVRTSYSSTLHWLNEDPAINLIMQKLCTAFDVNANQSEVLHVLHYSPGEEYKPHYDFFGGVDNLNNFDQDTQRIKTICVYLNDVSQGGETSFPRLNLEVSPVKGKAVFFENIDQETHRPYIDSLHAGKPVISGEKWLATLWIRNKNTNRGPDYE